VTVWLPEPAALDFVPTIGSSSRRKETAVSEYQATEETPAVDEEIETTAPVAPSDAEDDWNDD
jgi:hypothetical protein